MNIRQEVWNTKETSSYLGKVPGEAKNKKSLPNGIKECGGVPTTSLYIRRNYSLYEQLAKQDLKVLTLPLSPIEKQSLQERWAMVPSPLPELEPRKNCPMQMKKLTAFGFRAGKKPTFKGNVKNANPNCVAQRGLSGSQAILKTISARDRKISKRTSRSNRASREKAVQPLADLRHWLTPKSNQNSEKSCAGSDQQHQLCNESLDTTGTHNGQGCKRWAAGGRKSLTTGEKQRASVNIAYEIIEEENERLRRNLRILGKSIQEIFWANEKLQTMSKLMTVISPESILTDEPDVFATVLKSLPISSLAKQDQCTSRNIQDDCRSRSYTLSIPEPENEEGVRGQNMTSQGAVFQLMSGNQDQEVDLRELPANTQLRFICPSYQFNSPTPIKLT